jgi:hypothetical protein
VAHKVALKEQSDNQSSVEVRPLHKWAAVVLAASLFFIAVSGVWFIVWIGSAIADFAIKIGFITTSILNLFVFLAIVVQACIYWGQRNLMVRQWKAMRAQLEIMRTAQESFAIGERAYLIVEDAVFIEKGERPQMVFTLYNGGRTPAFEVSTESEASIGPLHESPTGKLRSLGHPYGEKAVIPASTKKQIVANFPNFTVKSCHLATDKCRNETILCSRPRPLCGLPKQ